MTQDQWAMQIKAILGATAFRVAWDTGWMLSRKRAIVAAFSRTARDEDSAEIDEDDAEIDEGGT